MYSQRVSSRHQHLVQIRDGGKVERVEALHRREVGGADAPLHRTPLTVDQLQLDQPQQIAGMIGVVAGALARHLVILPQHRRQLQLFEVMGQQHLWRAAHGADRHRVAGGRDHAAIPASSTA